MNKTTFIRIAVLTTLLLFGNLSFSYGLGTLDLGFIELNKYMSIIGGYKSDFSERNPIKYITWIRPDATHLATSGATDTHT